jgi:hypothetical protein
VDEQETAFKGAVVEYLSFCKELGEKPNRPYFSRLTLRPPQTCIPPSQQPPNPAEKASTSDLPILEWQKYLEN